MSHSPFVPPLAVVGGPSHCPVALRALGWVPGPWCLAQAPLGHSRCWGAVRLCCWEQGLTAALCLGLAARYSRDLSEEKLQDIITGKRGLWCVY